MFLYLIRHAHAVDSADDATRRLSSRGRAQAERLANFLRRVSLPQPDEVWHSSLVRAGETARLLAGGLAWEARLIEVDGLQPESPPLPIAARIDAFARTLAIVGHEPFLGALGAVLVRGSPWPPIFAMRKCGVLALERAAGSWVASWHLSPELFGPDD